MIKRTLVIILITILIFFGFANALLYTEAGSAKVIQFANQYLKSQVYIEEFSGVIAGRWQAQGIRLQHGPYELRINKLEVAWQPVALLYKKIDLQHVKAEIIHFTFNQKKNEGAKSIAFYADSLNGTAALTPRKSRIEELTIHSKKSYLTVIGDIDKQWHLKSNIDIKDIRDFTGTIPGAVSGTLNITGPRQKPSFLFHLNLTNTAHTDYAPGGMVIDGNIAVNKQHLSGSVTAKTDDLIFIENYLPISQTTGTLNAKIRLKGSLTQPVLVGNATLTNGTTRINSLGIDIQDISLVGEIVKKQMHYHGSLRSGTGTLNIKGKADLQMLQADMVLSGEGVTLYDTAQYRIDGTPNINLTVSQDSLEVKGTVDIPHARLRPESFNNTVTLPQDVEVIEENASQEAQSQPLKILTSLTINLGDDVKIDAFGLKGDLHGNVKISNAPGSHFVGTGQVSIKHGVFGFYGKSLKIEKGKLLYSGGSLDNPSIDFRAVKNSDILQSTDPIAQNQSSQLNPVSGFTAYTVGVQITGTLNAPNITLFSVPAGLSKQEILKILGGDTQLLLMAAGQLTGNKNLGKASQFNEKLTQGLGLSEISIGTQTYGAADGDLTQTTTLNLGKKITPRLYVTYSKGLTEPTNSLRVTYRLFKHFVLQSTSSEEGTGVDMIYAIEK